MLRNDKISDDMPPSMEDTMSKIVFITGVDGSGKSFFANWIKEVLTEKGFRTTVLWSRFNNYLSKPFLLLMRITGHNYYRTVNGMRFGYHDFESLGCLRRLFALLQAVDVNIASYLRIARRKNQYDFIICERGPWDTLIDVMADTGLKEIAGSCIGRMYTRSIGKDSLTLFISRDKERILSIRHELVNDKKLGTRIYLYGHLSQMYNWHVIDNNGSIPDTKRQISKSLTMNCLKS